MLDVIEGVHKHWMSHFLMLENWFMLMTNGGILDCIMKG
jgi:hypothetical protein